MTPTREELLVSLSLDTNLRWEERSSVFEQAATTLLKLLDQGHDIEGLLNGEALIFKKVTDPEWFELSRRIRELCKETKQGEGG